MNANLSPLPKLPIIQMVRLLSHPHQTISLLVNCDEHFSQFWSIKQHIMYNVLIQMAGVLERRKQSKNFKKRLVTCYYRLFGHKHVFSYYVCILKICTIYMLLNLQLSYRCFIFNLSMSRCCLYYKLQEVYTQLESR